MKLCVKRLRKAIGVVAALLCFGTATALADSINLSEVTADTNVVDGTTLTGTLGERVKITIADGATVTLDGVAINGVTDEDYSWAGITCEGGATIILEGTNTVKGFYENYPGIYVPEGKTLTIKGDGSLDASSNGYGAGIGGGYDISCGNIVIEGGTIVATGGYLATGIGGGGNGSCGAITIADTVTKVVATKYELNTPRSIGSGVNGSCGTVTIGGTVYPDGIEESPYIYPTYTATLKDGTEDAANWTITPNEGLLESNTVTVAYAGENKVKSVKAVKKASGTVSETYTLLSTATEADIGKVVCADGHLHDAKTAVPDGCTAVGIIGKVTETGCGLILALQDATKQTWNTINGWESTTGYAGTTLKVLPDDDARGANLTSYTALGDTPVSDWAVAQYSDYEAIFTNLGSTMGDDYGKTYDDHVEAYITTGVGGAAISGAHWSATENSDTTAFVFYPYYYWYPGENKTSDSKVRPVLGFGGEAMEEIEITVTPVEGETNEWTFQMPAADVVVEVAYLAVATFEVDGETYAVITNVVGKAVETPAEDPVKVGHSFAGWFTEATGGTQVTDETLMGIADTTFYAQFRAPILTIENGVLTAVDFNDCTNLNLVIPDTVTAIGESAFYQCTGLASVTIPGSVKTISHAAFRDCSNLTSVTIEEGVTTIGERAFARCVNLASITIPGTVTEISEAAFSDCKSLTSLTIPGSVKTIGPQAFQNCTGLESVTIEEGVETIRRVAFDGCENLSSVTIPDSVKEIGDDAFAGCSDALYEEGSGNLAGVKLVDGWAVGYDASSISENLDLTGVRGIAGGAFAGCDVITSVIIPDGVATIPEYVFNGCDNLTGVTIPDSVTSIGEGAFGGCDNFASVTIPGSVTSIGKDAFEGCSEELFDTTTIPGVALVDGWAVGYTDALPENLDLTSARGIADNAFRDSTLESVTIPGNVARVPAGAFMSCSSLASVTLEEGVTAIDDSAFIECAALESVEIPDTVTAIGPQAFVACASLANVTVPGSVAEIGPAAFGMCGSLTNITIEAGVTNIGMMAFAMCSALESVEIPDTVTAIGSQAFLMSMNLASVTIPSSVMEIGQDAFAYTALATVKVSYGDGERVKEMLAASGFDVSKLTFVEPLKLTFDPNGGAFAEGVETNRFLYAGAELGELPEATLTGYTLAGWFTAATEGDQVTATNKMGDADATIYAQWEINQYTITFDSNGGSDVATITNDYGTEVTAPADPAKTGYTFSGWTPAVPETIPASNTVCTAGWTINQYTISFDVNGGEGEFDPVTLDYGAAYGELPAPARTGYTFKGWFTAATNGYEVVATNKMGDADATIYAQWTINQYTITFVVEGETYAAITNDYGAAVTAPEAPTKTGYTFAGWDPEIPETIPAEDLDITAKWTAKRTAFEKQLSGDLATVADKVEAIADAFDGIEAITNLIAEINGYTVVQVADTVHEQIMASAEEAQVNDEIRAGLKAILGMTDDEITALPYVLVVDPFAFLTGKKVGLAYGEHGYILGEASASDICEIEYTGSKGNKYTVVADASDEEAARVFSIRKAGDAIPVAIKLPKTIALALVKNGEETLNATLALTGAEGKTYQVFRDDAYALDFSLAGTIKGKAVEFTASLDHTADRGYELETALKVDGEGILGIKAKGDNTPYDEETLAAYVGALEEAGGVWGALGKVLGFVNGRDLDSLEITIKDNIVIEGSVDEIGGMLAGIAQIVGAGDVTNEQIDAITAALNENVSYTVTQKNTGITAEGSFIASDLFGAYLPQPALKFEGETEAQTIVSRLTEDDWANIARVLVVGVKAAGDISTIAETVKAKVEETKEQLAAARRAAFEEQLSADLATVADKVEVMAEAFEGIDVITNLIAEINGVTVVDVAGTVFEQIMASGEQVEVNGEISEGLKKILGMTDDEIAALPHVLAVDPFAFLTGKKVGLAYGTHGYTLGEASESDICEIEYTGSKGNKYMIVADASSEEAARVFSFRKAGDAIPVAVKLPKTIALALVKNGEETLDATLALTGTDGKTYHVFRDDAYTLDISLDGTVKGKAVEFTASLDHTVDRGYELETALKVDGEGILGIKAKGDNTPYDERELAAYVGVLEEAGGVWGALGKVLGFVNGRDLDSLEITIKDNIVIAGSVDDIGGMLAGLAKMVSAGDVTEAQIDAITAALNANVKYTVTQQNTGITAEGSFIAGESPMLGKYLPLFALKFEGEAEAQPIVSRLTDGDWVNIARVLLVGVKAAGDISTIVESVKDKVAETKEQMADAAAAAEVVDAIDAIGEVAYTDECKALIDAARAAYDALTDAQKALVTNYETLTTAEAAYADMAEAGGEASTIDVPVIEGGADVTNVTVEVGQPYTDEVIAAITEIAQSSATRHGQVVAGWVNYDGSEVTGSTIVSTNDVLSAVWDTVNPLVPETLGEGAVDTAKAQKYEAYILDAEGAMRGTIVVTVGKANKKSGLSSVKAQVKLVGESKTYTFKATEAKGGKATLSKDAATEGVELYNKNLGTMTLDIGAEGVSGTLGEYEINGSRNTYKTDKAAYATWTGTWTAAIADADGAYSTFSVKVKKNGSVSVKGVASNGAKFSVTTRLMVADDGGEACVAVKGNKKVPVGFTLWLGLDADGAACAESVESASGDAVAGEDAAAGKAAVADTETWTLSAGGEAIATLGWNGSRFSGDKTASAKVTYANATGLFSGSYKIATTAANGKAKKTTVKFSGVFIDGVGYGVTTKGVVGLPVILSPATAK